MTDSQKTTAGRLYGVGLGPGDPDLMTVRAVELITKADVVAYHSARHGRSIARSIAARHLRADQLEEPLVYPVTTGTTDHPGGYRGALDEFYAEAAERLAAHLDAGRTVVVLAEGDPMFYGSYMHMHKRLAHRYPTEVVPGVTSVSAAAARLGRPLVEAEEVLTILPGTLPEEELTARLAATDSAVVMKLGRTFPTVRRALERSGRLAEAQFVERATMAGERTAPLAEVDPESVPYFSLAVLPSRIGLPPSELSGLAESSGLAGLVEPSEPVESSEAVDPSEASELGAQGAGSVVVVGLGPAGPLWLTPRRAVNWPPPTSWWATPPTWTGSRSGRASAGTARTTRWRPSGPSSRSTWPGAAAGSRWSPPATRASSRWPPPCWRRPAPTRTARCRCGSCPA